MSVLIKIDMPKSCPCELVGIGYDLYCSFVCGSPARVKEYDECCQNGTRPAWCPLSEVPAHGRLIDADVLIEDLKYDVELDAVALDSMEIVGDERRKIQNDKDFKQNCIFWIENAPTIIPAEPAEEGE